jgi:hypothetical protein
MQRHSSGMRPTARAAKHASAREAHITCDKLALPESPAESARLAKREGVDGQTIRGRLTCQTLETQPNPMGCKQIGSVDAPSVGDPS